ncbi:MAG TPA: hypothetical protein DCZ91_01610 [Lachnospiraceae bacterium]|nr:hypothetical protein [Lachnospiraceae bacterium]
MKKKRIVNLALALAAVYFLLAAEFPGRRKKRYRMPGRGKKLHRMPGWGRKRRMSSRQGCPYMWQKR